MIRQALTIEIVEEAGDWAGLDAARLADRTVRALSLRLPEAGGSATVALADDAVLRELNAHFRGRDSATNVLSFPSGGPAGPQAELGDVVLSVETLAREAAAEGKRIEDHFSHLVLHGLLHLLGYDHESDDDADLMERTEREVLAELGIADPYAEPNGKALQENDA